MNNKDTDYEQCFRRHFAERLHGSSSGDSLDGNSDLDEDYHSMTSSIVQYIVVRGDLLKELQWPVGALIAQACHAVTATTHLFHDDAHTQTYLKDLDNMHKVVLEAPDETSLVALKDKLIEAGVKHKLWIEQPENIPTCLVAKPYPKEEVQKYFKKFKLFKT